MPKKSVFLGSRRAGRWTLAVEGMGAVCVILLAMCSASGCPRFDPILSPFLGYPLQQRSASKLATKTTFTPADGNKMTTSGTSFSSGLMSMSSSSGSGAMAMTSPSASSTVSNVSSSGGGKNDNLQSESTLTLTPAAPEVAATHLDKPCHSR